MRKLLAVLICAGTMSIGASVPAAAQHTVTYVVKCQMQDGSWRIMSPGIFYKLPDADAWKIEYQKSTGLHCQTSSQ